MIQFTVIQCGGADILRDDAFAYSEALAAAGVDVEFHCYAGVPHCFASVLLTLPETALFYERYMAFLKKCTDRARS
jgi:acetyl esterase/lipase